LEKEPEIIGFSTYIWNITLVKRLVSDLKAAIPGVTVVLGGPEAEYSNESVPEGCKILAGEGEAAWYNYLTGENIQPSPDELPLYPPDAAERGKTVYYEASRGCPYGCSYCVSSIEKGTRFKSFARVKDDLSYFIENKVKKVKFIDRTFNINKDAREIFGFIIENAAETSFHFEIKPELFSRRDIELLKKAPAGLIQFEAGLQSLNGDALRAVGRANDTERAFGNLGEIISAGNIRVHIDLIAGLPLEDKKSFVDGFNAVYKKLSPDILQLGFLKILNGTALKRDAAEYGIKYSCYPPYRVISTGVLSISDIMELRICEKGLDTFANKGFFKNSLKFLFAENEISPYDLFKFCGESLKNKPPQSHPALFGMFYAIYKELGLRRGGEFLDLLIRDYRMKNPNKPMFGY
jgi:radical SAM superfamily enzyme YgiQ (UPF0313 family)